MALYKGLKMKGILKKSRAEKALDEEQQRMRHHHYHCERNPEGFQRLKLDNFDRMARKEVKKESERLRGSSSH